MAVVTMSGTLASGARELGQAAAQLLRIDYVDQQLLVEAAQRCGVPVNTMAERDERCAGFGERLAAMLRNFLERSAAAGGDPLTGSGGLEVLLSRSYAEMAAEREEPELSDAVYMKTMSTIIRELGERGNIVILGRGSQMILGEMPTALHVLAVAPQELRGQRLAQREAITVEEAGRRIHDSDRARAAFHRKFWKVDVNDPTLYDLALDTSRLPDDVSAELIAVAARGKAGAGA